jgi:hypothetical protein
MNVPQAIARLSHPNQNQTARIERVDVVCRGQTALLENEFKKGIRRKVKRVEGNLASKDLERQEEGLVAEKSSAQRVAVQNSSSLGPIGSRTSCPPACEARSTLR